MEGIFLFEPAKIRVEGVLGLACEGARRGNWGLYDGERNVLVVEAGACALYGNALKRTAVGVRLLALFGELCGAFLTIHGMFRWIHPMEMAIHGMDLEIDGVFRGENWGYFLPYGGEKRVFSVVFDLSRRLIRSLSSVSIFRLFASDEVGG